MAIILGQKGATLVECAVTFPFFFLMMIGLGETCVMSRDYLMLEHAVSETARWALIGQLYPGESNRVDSIKAKAEAEGQNFGVSIDRDQVSICPLSSATCSADDAGSPSQFIRITAQKPVNFPFLKLSLNLKATAVVRNEPFD